jgi:ribosomal protein S18 acetylase RimI-like enzyme
MSALVAARRSREDELDVLSAILTDAFVNEDGLNYWLKQGKAKERCRRQFFDVAVRKAIHPKRELWVAESDGARLGAAIWLPPGCKAFDYTPLEELMLTPRILAIAGFDGMARAQDLGKRLAKHHPSVPHAHLSFLGVHSSAQGRGVGSAILKQTLAPLDESGMVAYLEASMPRNVALYQRHGFEVTGEFELPNLHFWCMTRLPRR